MTEDDGGVRKTETMTSRERVVRTLNHEPVDRVPIDLGSHMSTGISAFAYWNLREHLGFPTDNIYIPDTVQFLATVAEDIRSRFHVDCILLEPPWPRIRRWNPRGKYEFILPAEMNPQKNAAGEWVVRKGNASMRMPEGGFFFDGDWINSWGEDGEDDKIARYAREAERIYKETPYATNFVGYTLGLGFGAYFGGMDRWERMITDPDGLIADHERECEANIARAGRILDEMGEYIQLITICDDMGGQTGPMCRPELVERCTMPFIKKFCGFVHENSDVKIFMHNCGSIRAYIPMLIEAGVDALNPVQISAANMDPGELKAEFGDDIVFWGGGCDTQRVLGIGTPNQVSENVRELVGIFKSGGGFVFNQVHNIMGDVPPENIVAMLDTAYEEAFL